MDCVTKDIGPGQRGHVCHYYVADSCDPCPPTHTHAQRLLPFISYCDRSSKVMHCSEFDDSGREAPFWSKDFKTFTRPQSTCFIYNRRGYRAIILSIYLLPSKFVNF